MLYLGRFYAIEPGNIVGSLNYTIIVEIGNQTNIYDSIPFIKNYRVSFFNVLSSVLSHVVFLFI